MSPELVEVGDNRPPVYWEEDKNGQQWLIIRASAIGTTCLWDLAAAGQGYEPAPLPDVLVRAFREGHELEPVVLAKMENEGWQVGNRQREGELELPGHIKIRYHPDGVGWIKTDRALFSTDIHIIEVKALSHDLWLRAARTSVGEVMAEYKWQISVMMHNENLSGMWVAYNKGTPPINDMGDRELCADEGKLIYEHVAVPPVSYSDIVERAFQVKQLVEGQDILESGRPCDDPQHWPCRYYLIRPAVEDSGDGGEAVRKTKTGTVRRTLTVDQARDGEVDRLVREYLHAKGIIDEAQSQFDRAKEALLEIGTGYTLIETGQWSIPIVSGSSSSTDWGSMPDEDRKELKRLLGEYSKKSEYRYIRSIKRRD
jgi:hypothetical protein